MQQFAASSVLKALPPALTLAAVINWSVYQYQLANCVPLMDIEQGNRGATEVEDHAPGHEPSAIVMHARSNQQQIGIANDFNQPRHRNSLRQNIAAPGSDAQVIAGGNSSGSDPAVIVRRAGPCHQQTSTINAARRPSCYSSFNLQSRLEDPENFVIGDDSDDSASLRN